MATHTYNNIYITLLYEILGDINKPFWRYVFLISFYGQKHIISHSVPPEGSISIELIHLYVHDIHPPIHPSDAILSLISTLIGMTVDRDVQIPYLRAAGHMTGSAYHKSAALPLQHTAVVASVLINHLPAKFITHTGRSSGHEQWFSLHYSYHAITLKKMELWDHDTNGSL